MNCDEQAGNARSSRKVIHAAGALDGSGVWVEEAAVVVEGGDILGVGRAEEVGWSQEMEVIDARDTVVIPGLVNAHCHLDLTHIGPVEYCGDFARWLMEVRGNRAAEGEAIRASVLKGAKLARDAGTVLVGDISGGGTADATMALRESGLGGVSFVEMFGLGPRQAGAISRMEELLGGLEPRSRGVVVGTGPHSPYSCGPELFEWAAKRGGRISTHIAESLDEIEFMKYGRGRIAEMLKSLGVWDETMQVAGEHPVEVAASAIQHGGNWTCAHVQYIEPHHIEVLAGLGVTVAYCPIASEYFGHPCQAEHAHGRQKVEGAMAGVAGQAQRVRRLWVGGALHPYRELASGGVNVAIGTDSIICLGRGKGISVLEEIRRLYRRDGTEVRDLVEMATVNGARALGFDEQLVKLRKGRTAGLFAVPIDRRWKGDIGRGLMESVAAGWWAAGPLDAKDEWCVR